MKKIIFTMCMVALSTVGKAQTTQQYLAPGVDHNPHLKYIVIPNSAGGWSQIQNPSWDENWDGTRKVELKTLAHEAEKNIKLQKIAHTFIGVGLSVGALRSGFKPDPTMNNTSTLNGLLAISGVCVMVGSIQLLVVNGRNTKIIFSLTHPL
jgi:hypothetical protein